MSTAAGPEIPDFPVARAPGCPFDPPPVWQALRNNAPVSKVRLWDGSTPWLVTRYADQRALLADPRVSVDSGRPGYPHLSPHGGGSNLGFLRMDDPEHSRLRRLVTAPFAVKRIEAMRPMVQKIVDDLVDGLLTGPKPVDLVEAFALPVPTLVISELLGVPYSDHQFFQENSTAVIRRTATMEERTAAGRNLGEYLGELVGRKLAEPRDDVLSELAARIKAGDLTHREATQIGVLLLIAGHETTANMIALGTVALMEHPNQLELLRRTDDPHVVATAVEELLRYLHITHNGMQRVAVDDIDIAGLTVHAGEGLLMLNEVGNRDPEAFPEAPDTLDITRDARHHIAFGFGVHQCLGQSLARMELQVVYSTLHRRIPTLRRAVGLDRIPFKHDAFIYGVHELPVTW
ncbi:cytochrome P450 [Streptomyces fuscichromogenes]|uniref:Cytochrome P450 n=1 Tax=Streptomyces fuscichromogenes TaxID=1324013 RepID=A0A917X9P0_9ACTN|nr:cytochrome P450 [Streptomyces fuscichromogenes]GGM97870.1 cytochrome P450 [Streptomyces fuscichromogenes]